MGKTYDPSFLNHAFGNFSSDCSFISIKSGKSAILLEDEFNESQIIQSEHRANLVRNMTSSGFIDKPVELLAPQNGGLVLKYDNITNIDSINLYQSNVVGNGYIITINSDNKDDVGNYVTIDLTSSNTGYDFVFLEFWLQDLSPIETTEQDNRWKNPLVYKYGHVDGDIKDYNIITNNVNFNGYNEPTTGRVQLQWKINVININNSNITLNSKEQDLYEFIKDQLGYKYILSNNDNGLYLYNDKNLIHSIDNTIYSLPMFIINKSNYKEQQKNNIKDLRKEVYINNDKFYGNKIKPLIDTIDIICEILGIDLNDYSKYPFIINKYNNLTTGGYLIDEDVVSSGCLIKNDRIDNVDDYVILTSSNRKNPGLIGEINVEKYSNRCYITNTGNANMNMKNYMISNIGNSTNNTIYRVPYGDMNPLNSYGIVGISSENEININDYMYNNSFIYAYPIKNTNGKMGELYIQNGYIKKTGNYTDEIEWIILKANDTDNIIYTEIQLNGKNGKIIDMKEDCYSQDRLKDNYFGDKYSVFFSLPMYDNDVTIFGDVGDIYAIIEKDKFTVYNTGNNINVKVMCMIIHE